MNQKNSALYDGFAVAVLNPLFNLWGAKIILILPTTDTEENWHIDAPLQASPRECVTGYEMSNQRWVIRKPVNETGSETHLFLRSVCSSLKQRLNGEKCHVHYEYCWGRQFWIYYAMGTCAGRLAKVNYAWWWCCAKCNHPGDPLWKGQRTGTHGSWELHLVLKPCQRDKPCKTTNWNFVAMIVRFRKCKALCGA